jgi:hypothetical protein
MNYHPNINCCSGKTFWTKSFHCVKESADAFRTVKNGKEFVSLYTNNPPLIKFDQGTPFQTAPAVMLTSNAGSASLEKTTSKDCKYQVSMPCGESHPSTCTVDWIASAPLASGQWSEISAIGTSSMLAGSTRTVVATLKDANQTPFTSGGARVSFAASQLGIPIAFAPVVDQDDGTYTSKLQSSTLGRLDVTASIEPNTSIDPHCSLTIVQASGSASSVLVDQTVVEVGDVVSLTVRVVAADGVSHVSGAFIQCQQTAGLAGSVEFGDIIDKLDGSYTIPCLTKVVGSIQLGAVIKSAPDAAVSVPIQQRVAVNIVSPGVFNASLSTFKPLESNGTGQLKNVTDLILCLADTNGTPIPNAASEISVSIQPQSAGVCGDIRDNLDGSYTIPFVGNVTGQVSFTAALGGVQIVQQVMITVLGPSNDLSTFTLNQAAEYAERPIHAVVIVRDTANAPISNMVVKFVDNDSVLDASATEDIAAQGVYEADILGLKEGPHKIGVIVENVPVTNPRTRDFFVKAQTVPAPPLIQLPLIDTTGLLRIDANVTAAEDDGGSVVQTYQASAAATAVDGTVVKLVGPESAAHEDSAEPTRVSILNDLVAGTKYTITVVARNSHGESAPSSGVDAVLYTKPSIPLHVQASVPLANDAVEGENTGATLRRTATVSFDAPPLTGGKSITKYTARSNIEGLSGAIENVNGFSATTLQQIPVTGLVPGTPYTFTVAATNSIGESELSQSSGPVVAYTVADPPTNVQATYVLGTAVANVSFVPPSAEKMGGYATAEGYMVRSLPTADGATLFATSDTNCIEVPNLVPGTAYQFCVVTKNAVGESQQSAASAFITAFVNPDPPSNLTTDPIPYKTTTATVSLVLPQGQRTGGDSIQTCTVSVANSLPASSTSTVPDVTIYGPFSNSHITVPIFGLAFGVFYAFHATVTNGAGLKSDWSLASNAVKAVDVPGAPTIVGLPVPGIQQLTIVFNAPEYTGGDEITAYVVYALINGARVHTLVDGQPVYLSTTVNVLKESTNTQFTAVVGGLDNTNKYTFEVEAKNIAGSGATSAPSVEGTPVTSPDAPTLVTVDLGDQTLRISFGPSQNAGGGNIDKYLVSVYLDGSSQAVYATERTAGSSAYTVDVPESVKLTNGVKYIVDVAAHNEVGYSQFPATTHDVIPRSVPGIVRLAQVQPDNASKVNVSFNSPTDNGGNEVKKYVLYASTSATDIGTEVGMLDVSENTMPMPQAPYQVTTAALNHGVPYFISVVAINDAGTGHAVTQSNIVPRQPPSAPSQMTATPDKAACIDVAFDKPADDGGNAVKMYAIYAVETTASLSVSADDLRVHVGSVDVSGLVVPIPTAPYTIKTSALKIGSLYTISVQAFNDAGAGVSVVYADNVTPTVQLTLTLRATTNASNNATLDGTIMVAGIVSGVTWEYKFGSDWMPGGSGTSFVLPVGMYESSTVRVRITDVPMTESVFNQKVIVMPPSPPTNISFESTGYTITGQGEPGTTVIVTVNGVDQTPVNVVNSDGSFSVQLTTPVISGDKVTVTLRNQFGNASAWTTNGVALPPSPLTLDLLGDTGTYDNDGITRNAVISVNGIAPGATWFYKIKTGDWQTALPSSNSTFVLPGGTYDIGTVSARQTVGTLSSLVSYLNQKVVIVNSIDIDATSITIDTIAGDDILNFAEAAGDVTVTGAILNQPLDTVAAVALSGGTSAQAFSTTSAVVTGNIWSVTVHGNELAQYTSVNATLTLYDASGTALTPKVANRSYSVRNVVPSTPYHVTVSWDKMSITGTQDGGAMTSVSVVIRSNGSDSAPVTSVVAADLTWSVKLPKAVSPGDTIIATAQDAAGNTASDSFLIPNIPPLTLRLASDMGADSDDGITNDGTIVMDSISDQATNWAYTIGAGAWQPANGARSFVLPPGTYEIGTVRAFQMLSSHVQLESVLQRKVVVNVGPIDISQSSLNIDTVTNDNVLDAAEAAAVTGVVVSGTLTNPPPDTASKVTVTLGTTNYNAELIGTTWHVTLLGSELALYDSVLVSATFNDVAGNVASMTATRFYTVMRSPNSVRINATGDVITGNGAPGTTAVAMNAANNILTTGGTNETGNFTLNLNPRAFQNDVIFVSLHDSAGNTSSSISVSTFSLDPVPVDMTSPATPTIAVTADGHAVNGTGEPGTFATLTVNGHVLGTVDVDEHGNWSLDLTGMTNAGDLISVTLKDQSGNVSASASTQIPVGSLTLSLAQDTGVSNSDGTTRDGTILVTGLASGASWAYKIGSADWVTAQALRTTFILPPGIYGGGTVQARQTVSGTTGPETSLDQEIQVITSISTTATTLTIRSISSDDILNAAEIAGSVDVVCTLSNPPPNIVATQISLLVGNTSYTTPSAFAGSTWTASVPGSQLQLYTSMSAKATLTDIAGNQVSVSSVPKSYTVDVTPPAAPTNVFINTAGTILSGRGESNNIVSVTDDAGNTLGTTTVNASGIWTTSLSPAPVFDATVIKVILQDPAGNISPPWTGTKQLLTPLILSLLNDTGLSNNGGLPSSDGITNDGTVSLTGLLSGATWDYKIGSNPWIVNNTGATFVLPSGTYEIGTVFARQSVAGNTGPTTSMNQKVVVITSIDVSGVTLTPGNVTTDNVLTVTEAANSVTVGCTVNGAISSPYNVYISFAVVVGVDTYGDRFNNTTVFPKNNSSWQWSGVTIPGSKLKLYNSMTFTATFIDTAGNQASVIATKSYTVQTTPAVPTPPAAPTNLTINSAGTVLSGKGAPGTTAYVISQGSSIVNANGVWAVNVTFAWVVNATVSVYLTDAAGLSSPTVTANVMLIPRSG